MRERERERERERAKEVGHNITVEETKGLVQNRRTRRISEILTLEDHDIEVVRTFKYLGTVINNTEDETEEIKARILAANKACCFLQTVLRCKQIHRNNKIRLYKALMKPVLCYGSVHWTQTQMTEHMLYTFERKILRSIYGPVQYKGHCHRRWNSEIYNLY